MGIAGQEPAAVRLFAIDGDSMTREPRFFAVDRSHGQRVPAARVGDVAEMCAGMGAEVLPTSILFDAKGKEVWRYVGDQDWTSPAAARLLAEGGVAKGS